MKWVNSNNIESRKPALLARKASIFAKRKLRCLPFNLYLPTKNIQLQLSRNSKKKRDFRKLVKTLKSGTKTFDLGTPCVNRKRIYYSPIYPDKIQLYFHLIYFYLKRIVIVITIVLK